MPLELRRWFQVLVAAGGYGVAGLCFHFLRSALPVNDDAHILVLVFMSAGAGLGFGRLLAMFLPLALVKMWPRLDR